MTHPTLSGNMLRELRYLNTTTQGGVMLSAWCTSHRWICRRRLVDMGYAEITIRYQHGAWIAITQKGRDYLASLNPPRRTPTRLL